MQDLMNHNKPSADDTKGLNIIPFAMMAGGWIGPLLMFWLYVWGPLRPFDYSPAEVAPSLALFVASFLICLTPWWLPAAYYEVRRFERSGRLYELLGVRLFRRVVPDGDYANRWRRREQPSFRVISNRRLAAAFAERTKLSEKSHLVLLLIGMASSVFAWQIGWRGWAVYLAAGNVPVNVYPVFLQRYTRARIFRILAAGSHRSLLDVFVVSDADERA